MIDFWKVKHQIDDEVARLEWSTDQCIDYIKTHYNKSSRLRMTDEQLTQLLAKLRSLTTSKVKTKASNRRSNRRSRRL